MKPFLARIGFVVLCCPAVLLWGRPIVPPSGVVPVPADQRAELRAEADRLGAAIRDLETAGGIRRELIPDVKIFHKAVDCALRFDEFQQTNEIVEARRQLRLGFARAEALRAGRPDWIGTTGMVVRGYVSKVDGSVQPYGVVVGPEFKPGGRLDVWLHGRDEKLTELRFLRDRMRSAGEFAPADGVVVHPYGRYCNAFKFAGETDVLEATEHARQAYGADAGRLAIRGFSMGGGGTWHLAAHHPGLWKVAAPGAGFAETAEYTGILNRGPAVPTWEQVLWRWYDAPVYAANLRQLPVVAYSGEKDRQIQAARVMERAMQAEGLVLEHLIGPGVEHRYEPKTKLAVAARVDALMNRERPVLLHLDLVTATLRYPAGVGDVWARFEGLARHWEPARIRATVKGPGRVEVRSSGVSAFALRRPPGTGEGSITLDVDGTGIRLADHPGADGWWHLRNQGGRWAGATRAPEGAVKRSGLQGPIDDAFMDSFVVVVPGPAAAAGPIDRWVEAGWRKFVQDWRAQFRGDCRVRRDTEVTEADIRDHHLIVWGTPRSNRLLARVAARLPVGWDRDGVRAGGRRHEGAGIVPALIAPNPLNPDRYIVVNSGHTFADWDGTNARQTPRLPDWAVLDVTDAPDGDAGRVMDAGFFGEDWK